MNIGVEYAIKQDVRNNPVVREVDLEQKRDFLRTLLWAAVVVSLLIFAAWPRFKTQQSGIRIEDLRDQEQREKTLNSQYRLELEAVRRPQKIEQRATGVLHMTRPSEDETITLQRVPAPAAAGAIVAAVR